MRPIRLLKPGDRFIRAADINEIILELVRQGKFRLEGESAELESDGSGVLLNVPKTERGIWAKVTSGTNPYAWTEQTVGTGGTFSATSNGRSGTTTQDPAYEINDNAMVAANTIVWMERTYVNVSGSTVSQEWTFTAGGGSGATTLSVEEVDGSPVVSTVTRLLFDQDDGFVVSQPSAGVARIDKPFSGARVTGSLAGQNISAQSTITVNFGSEVFDTDGYWAIGTPSDFVLTQNRYYHVGGLVYFPMQSGAAFEAGVTIVTNGAALVSSQYGYIPAPVASGATQWPIMASGVFKATSASPIFQLQAYNGHTATITIDLNAPVLFWLHRLGT